MSKYKNRKLVVNGEVFDSRKEFLRWQELRKLEQAGVIKELQRQVKFILIPPQYATFPRFSEKTGKRIKDGRKLVENGCSYVADFVYAHHDGAKTVEDVKGVRTPSYIIKRKLMLWVHGIRIIET